MKKTLLAILSLSLIVLFLPACSTFHDDIVKEEGTVFSHEELLRLTSYEHVENDEKHVLIRLQSMDQLSALQAELDLDIIKEWETLQWVKVATPQGEDVLSFLETMEKREDVLFAEPNMLYETTAEVQEEALDYKDRLWGMDNIMAHGAWDISTGSEDVIVAIVDTGVDVEHPEWEGHTIVGPYNATDDPFPATWDYSGHGTHVAGTAVTHDDTGAIHGVSWESPLMPIRVMDLTDGNIWTDYLVNAMLYLGDFADDHPDKRVVANMSIGGRGYSAALKDAIDYAKEQGVLLVTSAGNARKQVISFPAAYNGVVSVAATDGNNEKANFSTTGWWLSVAAPGTKTWSAYPEIIEPNKYAYLQGTSMASPHVAGAAALLLSVHPDLTPLEMMNQMEQTAQGDAYTPELGYGVIDVEAMLGELEPMQYGSLKVETTTPYGILTLFNEHGELAFFGSANDEGFHIFHALQPGTYTVVLSHGTEVAEKTDVEVMVGETTTAVMADFNDEE